MKYIILIAVLLLAVGCSEKQSPVDTGKLVTIEIADKSLLGDPKSHSWNTYHGGSIELYPNFVIVTTDDGLSRVATYDRIKKLEYKK